MEGVKQRWRAATGGLRSRLPDGGSFGRLVEDRKLPAWAKGALRRVDIKMHRVSFSQFGESTSLHGLKYISDGRSAAVRRTIWLCLLAASLFCLGIQLRSKIADFMGNPVSLEMDVDYASALPLPAILLCNTNYFRLSASTAAGMYDVVGDVFNDTDYRSITDLAYPVLHDLNGPEFVRDAAHQLSDMLIYCLWPNGTRCNETDFQSRLTDYGFCYSINHSPDLNASARSENPGIGYGLYLLLNAEDYEAMPGPQRTVGIKVLIYNQTDIPLVSEYGFDLAPGFQTSIGLKYSQTIKLAKEDGGNCGSVPLQFFPEERTYSRQLCTVDHKYRAAYEACGCLAYNMPLLPGTNESAYCSSQDYFSCMTEAMQRLGGHSEAGKCPETCERIDYQQYISFAQLSTPKVGALLSESGKRKRMTENFLNAAEAKSRYVGQEEALDNQRIQALLSVYEEAKERGMEPPNPLPSGLFNASCFHSVVEELLKGNGSRLCAFDLNDKVTGGALPDAFTKLGDADTQVEAFGARLNGTCGSIALVLSDIEDLLSHQPPEVGVNESLGREAILAWVREDQHLSTIHNRLEDIRLDIETRGDAFLGLVGEVKAHLKDVLNSSDVTPTAMDKARGLEGLSAKAESCVQDRFMAAISKLDGGGKLDRQNLTVAKTSLEYACEYLSFCLESLDEFSTNWRNYSALRQGEANEQRSRAEELRSACRHFDTFRQLEIPTVASVDVGELYRQVLAHITDFQNHNITKAEFGRRLMEMDELPTFPLDVQLHFSAIGARIGKLEEAVVAVVSGLERVREQLKDPQLVSLYLQLFHGYNDVKEIEAELDQLDHCLPLVKERLDNGSALASRLFDSYKESWRGLTRSLLEYENSLVISQAFYRKNLLALSIYVREMSVEVIRQVPAYNVPSLMCDIGGTLGLFVGASFLTLAELIEYLFLYLVGLWGRWRRPRPASQPPPEIAVVAPVDVSREKTEMKRQKSAEAKGEGGEAGLERPRAPSSLDSGLALAFDHRPDPPPSPRYAVISF